jgi:hypothetical protein
VLRDGLTLWGSGAPIYGQGNRYLGGIYPLVDGLGRGPAITLANRVTVAGFEITQSSLPTIELAPNAKPGKPSIDLAGIYGEDVTDVTILHNYIHGSGYTSSGIQLDAYSIPSLRATISDNRIDDVRGDGIAIYGGNISDMDLTLANNTVTRCDGTGLEISANGTGSGDFIARISGDYSGNDNQGIYLQAHGFDMAAALLVDTRANNNANTGIFINMWDNGLSGVLMASHENLNQTDAFVGTVLNNIPFLPMEPGTGLSVVDLLGVRSLYRDGGSMQANGNGGSGIYINQNGDDNLVGLLGVEANDNHGFASTQQAPTGGGSGGIYISQSGDVSVAALIRTEANRNEGAGIRTYSGGDDMALNIFMDVSANENANYGIRSSTYSGSGWAGAVVLSSEPVLSLIQNLSSSPLVSDFVNPMDMGFIPAYGQVQANRNGGSGIYMDAYGYDGAFGVVLDAQASGNGLISWQPGNGIQVQVNSENGMALALVSSTEALVNLGSRLLTAASIPLDLSAVRTLGPVEVNDNRDNGVMVYAHGHDDAIAAVLGVEALWNGFGNITDLSPAPGNGGGGDGIYLDVSSQYGDAMAGLAMIYASANRGDGIYANVRSDSLFSEAMLGGIYLTANENGGNGLNLNVRSQAPSSSYLVLGGVQASENEGAGINAWLGGEGSIMAALTGIDANNNGNDGIYMETDSYSGGSHVWLSDTAIQDMSDHGGGFDLLGMDIIPLLPSGDINANNNGDSGVQIVSDSTTGSVLVNVANVTATGNDQTGLTALLHSYDSLDAELENNTFSGNDGNGVRLEATSDNDNVWIDLDDNTASDNGKSGIKTLVSASRNADVDMRGNVLNNNSKDGLNLHATAGQRLKLFAEYNVLRDNGDDGFDVKTSAASGSGNRRYDFGGGVLGSEGYNVMSGNGDYDLERSGPGSFSAQYNYWDGIVPPAYGSEYTGNNIDVSNALSIDPTTLP